jgi:hypothetical protein
MKQCEKCGQQIAAKRIEAKPNTKVCIVCQTGNDVMYRANLIADGKSDYHFEIVDPQNFHLRRGCEIDERGY